MTRLTIALLISGLFLLQACGQAQMGSSGAKSVATGSAAGSHTEGSSSDLERCTQPLGTVSIFEDQYARWISQLPYNHKTSTVPILRLLAQQSNCFVVVERGAGLDDAMQERRFQESGELRQGSNFGKGQMVAADYTMKPDIIFSDNNVGGIGGTIGGILGGSVGSMIGGAINFSDAQGTLTLVDNRSSVQVAVSEGSSRGMDFGGITGLFGSSAGGVLGGYSKTPEGKVIVGAMMDAFNNMVRALRNYEMQEASGPLGHGTGGRLQVAGSTTPTAANSAALPNKAKIKEAQQLLQNMGFDVGTADGIMGERTRRALRNFQKMSNLNVTGEVDDATLAKLRGI